ncbi:hypothetical protein [Lentibacillus sp. L22]
MDMQTKKQVNNSIKIPQLGLGVYKVHAEEVYETVNFLYFSPICISTGSYKYFALPSGDHDSTAKRKRPSASQEDVCQLSLFDVS